MRHTSICQAVPLPLARWKSVRSKISSASPRKVASTALGYLKDNYDDTAKLKKYWGYLANNVVFIQISTDVSSALKIFEIINERGVGLNPMDLLKNLLFTQVKQTQFTQIKDEWKKITNALENAREIAEKTESREASERGKTRGGAEMPLARPRSEIPPTLALRAKKTQPIRVGFLSIGGGGGN